MVDQDFTAKCKEHFGKTPEHINYVLRELDTRISRLEKERDETNPIIGAAIAKTEAIAAELIKLDYISDSSITANIRKYLEK